MGAKQILRMQKLKSAYSVNRSLKHAFREQDTPNADPARLTQNVHSGASNAKEAMGEYRKLMAEAAKKKKIRKNAVHVVEYLITASPEYFSGENSKGAKYFNEALDFLHEKHGAENVFYAGVHYDEKTPHMYAYVVPRDGDGKLNCRHFFGPKDALSKMQDDFHSKVASKVGLERGLKGSKAKHKTIKKYYEELNQAMQAKPEKPTRIEHLMAAIGISESASERFSRVFSNATKLKAENERMASLREQDAQLNEELASQLEIAKKDLEEIDSLRENLMDEINKTKIQRSKLEAAGVDIAMQRDNGKRELESKVQSLESELGKLAHDYQLALDENIELAQELDQIQQSRTSQSLQSPR